MKKTEDFVSEVKEVGKILNIKKKFISTGSTLLDLAISGKANWEGGLPSGTLIELWGQESCGKTAILMEIASTLRAKGGTVKIADVEQRINTQYAKTYGLSINESDYYKPQTIEEFFAILRKFPNDTMNLLAGDSLSALSTEQELEKGDKMGGLRAKMFSQELRKAKGIISNTDNFLICTNQARDNMGGYGDHIVTSGGRAIKHYASVRIRMDLKGKLKTSKTINGNIIEKVYGVQSECKVVKNSEDDPYRCAPIYIIFAYGIDDIRGNLEYLKEVTGSSEYESGHKRIDKAIEAIESGGVDVINELRNKVILTWHEIEEKFNVNRLQKVRQHV